MVPACSPDLSQTDVLRNKKTTKQATVFTLSKKVENPTSIQTLTENSVLRGDAAER